jgi:hypothetical protein
MNRPNDPMTLKKAIYGGLAWCAVALGFAGVFIPGLPTTVFVIAASWLFARSSPRFDEWLRRNRWFGPSLRRFRESGGMARSTKIAALTSMWAAIAMSSVPLASLHLAGSLITLALGGVGTLAILFAVRTV